MAYVHKEGRGSMFKNTRKTSESQPEWKGDFMGLPHDCPECGKGIPSEVYDIAMWWLKDREGNVKKDKDGNTIMSLKVSHKRPRDDAPKEEAPQLDDEIPF